MVEEKREEDKDDYEVEEEIEDSKNVEAYSKQRVGGPYEYYLEDDYKDKDEDEIEDELDEDEGENEEESEENDEEDANRNVDLVMVESTKEEEDDDDDLYSTDDIGSGDNNEEEASGDYDLSESYDDEKGRFEEILLLNNDNEMEVSGEEVSESDDNNNHGRKRIPSQSREHYVNNRPISPYYFIPRIPLMPIIPYPPPLLRFLGHAPSHSSHLRPLSFRSQFHDFPPVLGRQMFVGFQ